MTLFTLPKYEYLRYVQVVILLNYEVLNQLHYNKNSSSLSIRIKNKIQTVLKVGTFPLSELYNLINAFTEVLGLTPVVLLIRRKLQWLYIHEHELCTGFITAGRTMTAHTK